MSSNKPFGVDGSGVLEKDEFSRFLGQAVMLLVSSKEHKSKDIASIEKRILPALLLKQFKFYQKSDSVIALLTWALVDEERKMIFADPDAHLSLTDWRSGKQIIVVDCVSPFGPKEILQERFLKEMGTASKM